MLKNKNYVYGAEAPKVPAHLHYGQHMLERFEMFSERTALIEAATGASISFAQLSHQSINIALSLARAGIKRGDVAGVCSEDRIEYITTLMGVICAGATFTHIDITGKATIIHRLKLVTPKIMFCSPTAYKALKETLESIGNMTFVIFGEEPMQGATLLRDFIKQDGGISAPISVKDFECVPVNGATDYAIVTYSSGTTGLSKGVPCTHLNILCESYVFIDNDSYYGKVVLAPTEFFPFTMACLHAGATVVLVEHDSAKYVLLAVHKYKPQIIQIMPPTILELVKTQLDDFDVESLEKIFTGSSSLDAELVKAAKKRLPNLREVCQFYGLTEMATVCQNEKSLKGTKAGSVGTVTDGAVVKVIDQKTREPLGPNERGEICVKGPCAFKGYLDMDNSLLFDAEGFYATGDIGYYDEDRYFYIVDRIKDIIKYNGFTIAPAEMEAILLTHSAVREAGVIGAPSVEHGECATAFVAKQPGAVVTEAELTQYVNDSVPTYIQLAGGVRFVDSLPRGGRNKIDRKALRNLL